MIFKLDDFIGVISY